MTTTMRETPTRVLPPGPKPLPYVGNGLSFRNNQAEYVRNLQRTYGDIVTFYLGETPVIGCFKPEHVRYFLTENPKNFASGVASGGLRELTGDGLLTLDGEAHRQQRRLVQPAFHKKRVENYADTMVQYTQERIKSWYPGEKFNMALEMQELTLRIVAKCLFNADLSDEVQELGPAFTDMIGQPISLLETFLRTRIDWPFTSYGKRMAAKRKVDAYIYKLIEQRRAEGGDQGDMMSMLLTTQEEGGRDVSLTNTQVHDHIMTFFAAGHETTANALVWTFYLLSKNPPERAKLLSEIQSVLGTRPPTVEDLAKLPYTEWVLNESMRLYPPAWTQGRTALAPFELDGYHFPAGTILLFSQYVIHHRPDIWEHADEFRPERWDPEQGQKVPQFAYFPFGGGPRICIGMPFAQLEAKLLLVTILQRYLPQVDPNYQAEIQPLITLRPKNGLPVTLSMSPLAASNNGSPSLNNFLPATRAEGNPARKGCRSAFEGLFKLLGI